MTRPPKHACAFFAVLAASLLGLSATPAGAADWTTYHLDNTRDGNDTSDAALSTATQAWTSGALSGQVYASPVYFGGNVYVATETDDLYAFSGTTGSVLTGWPIHLGTAVDTSAFPCGDINPVGVTSAPVIDPTTSTLYVVGLETDSTPGLPRPYAHHLWAINLSTRAVRFDVRVDAPGSDPEIQNQRGAVTLAGGHIYVPFGGRIGDCGLYHGYVVAVSATDGSGLISWHSSPNSCGAGIWASGGLSVDASGNVYAATGNNSCGSSTFDYSESVVQLSPALALQSWWAPSNWLYLDGHDIDIGSIEPLLLGSSGYIFQAGKNSVGYILNSAALGGTGANPVSSHSLNMGGCFGSAAFDGARIYVGCSNGLVALNYNSTTHDFSVAWTAGGGFADSPIVAGGAVWYPDRAHAQLKAVDAATGALRFAFSAAANHFATPAAGDGKVFLSLSNSVVAYSMGTATPVAGNGSTTYTLDGYGGVHPAGTAPVEIAGPSWSWDIARGLAVFSDGSGGYVLDGWGAAHPFAVSGGSLPPTPAGPYFPNFDIARAIALAPWATSANPAGWILDGWGGVHPFGSAPSVGPTAYWPNWDIARGLVILGDSTPSSVKGYTLDGWGGLHPFGGAPAAAGLAYWPNWDIARGVALLPGTTSAGPVKGYTLDGWGGVHPFGGAPAVAGAYWPNWDIARGITLWDSGSGGWTLDGWGGLHAFGGAPTLSATAYTVGHDIFRACSSGGGQGPAESGGRHYP